MKRLARLLRREDGQSMTEFALLAAMALLAGGTLLKFTPDALDGLHIYLMGIYYIVGTPLG